MIPENWRKANILQYLEQLRYDSRPTLVLSVFMLKRVSVVLSSLVLVLPLSACSRKEANEPPVATPTLTLSRQKVPIGSPLQLTYRFEMAPDAKIDGDYWVFVHVLEPDGERLWVEDHLPPTPTSTWKPGQKIEYTRTVFVPNYPYIGAAVVRLGLYSPKTNQRLALGGEEVSRREYLVTKFELLPQSENIFLIYKEGWHPAEVSSDDPNTEWQWTKKSATISFKNPRKDATFYLQYAARTDKFAPPQQVTIKVAGQPVGTFTADAKDRVLVTFPITAAQLGPADVTELTIDVDRTFVPGGTDVRELGIQVFHAFVEAK
jgi:hypothetical protein